MEYKSVNGQRHVPAPPALTADDDRYLLGGGQVRFAWTGTTWIKSRGRSSVSDPGGWLRDARDRIAALEQPAAGIEPERTWTQRNAAPVE